MIGRFCVLFARALVVGALLATTMAVAPVSPTAEAGAATFSGPWTAVDFREWNGEGLANHGFVVSADGSELRTTLNPITFSVNSQYVSPEVFDEVEVRGTLAVETTSDDDVIGFLFGYQQPFAVNGDNPVQDRDFVAFTWKQRAQTFNGIAIPEGLRLSRYLGDGAGGTEVLDSQTGIGTGWADNTEYSFRGVYTSSRVEIYIDDALVLEADGTFEPGAIAAFVTSQRDAVWRDFEYRVPTEVVDLLVNAGPDQVVQEGDVVALDFEVTGVQPGSLPEVRTDDITVRDWSVTNPDYAFNHPIVAENGIVEDELGADSKPSTLR